MGLTKKQILQKDLKNKGLKLPHGYEISLRKKPIKKPKK